MIIVSRANGNVQEFRCTTEQLTPDLVRVCFPHIILLPGDVLSVRGTTTIKNDIPQDYNTHRE